MKPINNFLAFCHQLGIHCINVRFPQWVARQIDLAQHVEAELPMTIVPQEEYGVSWLKDARSAIDQTRLQRI